jgi:hypothetical protein
MIRRPAVEVLTVLLVLVGTMFVTAPGASAGMYWVAMPGNITPKAMTAANTASGSCTENFYVRACVKPEADPEVFFAKDNAKDGASVGVYVHVEDTGYEFACYQSYGVGDIGRCTSNIGEGNLLCMWALKWDRSLGDVPVIDLNSRICVVA